MKPLALSAAWLITCLLAASPLKAEERDASPPLTFELQRVIAHQGFDGEKCWVHARAGAVPAAQTESAEDDPLVVMTMQKLLLSGSDVFYALHQSDSRDGGKTWSEPEPIDSFRRQTFPADPAAAEELPTGAAIAPHLLQAGDETTVCDFTPKWHAASQRLLGTGHTVWYRDNHVMHVRPKGIAYAVFDPKTSAWSSWDTVDLPDLPAFQSAGSGSVQRIDLIGGDILLPIYFKEPTAKQNSVTVCRCRFDGRTLEYVEHGDELTVDIKRGLYEPSLTRFQGRFYLTMRNDDHGYVSVSDDGLHFAPPQRWTFDDGEPLGNYNTQQHWVTHSDGLFLVYTRRGAGNDHVFRHRAPLFIARVDPETLQVVRASERVIVPQRGARLGNFGVVEVSPHETWVTAAEWMQPAGVEQHGSNNSVFVAKLKWSRPNRAFADPVSGGNELSDASSGEIIQPYFTPPLPWQDNPGQYSDLLRRPKGAAITSPAGWQRRRQELRQEWERWLGAWPPLITDPEVEILDSQRREDFTQHQIRFHWTPQETTTGYLLVPPGEGPHPAVLTVYYEPETAIGQGKEDRDFALQLTRRGFVTLSIGTTEATAARTYALYHPSIEAAEVEPLSMLAYAAANAWHVLADRPKVDAERIGIVGHSFGGKWAMFAACLFERFACGVWSDPGIVFDATRPSINYWEPWYLGYHPPPWRKRGLITPENPARGSYPELVAAGRDLHELHALMAPRPFLVSGGAEDPPKRWQPLQRTIAVNRLLGYADRVAMTNRPDHGPNPDSNAVIAAFFTHFLKPGGAPSAPDGP